MTAQRSVRSMWHGGLRCEVAAGEFILNVDEPASAGGTDSGPEPTELLLASIASCFTLAVAYSARKRSLELRDLSVTVTGFYDGLRFRSISIDSVIGCDPTEIDGLVSAAERVCYVTNTLRSGVDIVIAASSSVS